MKLTILTLLFPLFCFSQSEKASSSPAAFQDSIPESSFYMKDRNIIYQKVFTSDLSKEELADKIGSMLNSLREFRFDRNPYLIEGEFYGKLIQHNYDLERNRFKITFSTPSIIGEPIDASVVIQIKNHKYRVTISEITFRSKNDKGQDIITLLSSYLTDRNRTKIERGNSNLKVTTLLSQDFTDMFDVSKSVTAGDF